MGKSYSVRKLRDVVDEIVDRDELIRSGLMSDAVIAASWITLADYLDDTVKAMVLMPDGPLPVPSHDVAE